MLDIYYKEQRTVAGFGIANVGQHAIRLVWLKLDPIPAALRVPRVALEQILMIVIVIEPCKACLTTFVWRRVMAAC